MNGFSRYKTENRRKKRKRKRESINLNRNSNNKQETNCSSLQMAIGIINVIDRKKTRTVQ